MKIELSSQRREMLLFLTTNMAAVTSRANQQFALVLIGSFSNGNGDDYENSKKAMFH